MAFVPHDDDVAPASNAGATVELVEDLPTATGTYLKGHQFTLISTSPDGAFSHIIDAEPAERQEGQPLAIETLYVPSNLLVAAAPPAESA